MHEVLRAKMPVAAKRCRRAPFLWVALGLGLSACGGSQTKKIETTGPVEDVKPAEDAWREQSLALSVVGFMYKGGTKPEAAAWSGSGAWIGPNLAVTNAHVALRSVKITAKDDLGREVEFNEILAIDEEADLAILRATGESDRPALAMIDMPEDPKALRGTDIRVIGNTGGLGLSFYKGRITNVVGKAAGAVLLHDANTAGGSSGGPLIAQDSGKLVGINHSSLPSLNAKAAAPSWIVDKLLTKAKASKGLPLKKAFDPANLPVDWYVERAVCMKPGEAFKGVFAAVATNDLVVHIKPAQKAPMAFVLARGGGAKAMAQAVVSSETVAAWTLKGGGQYVYALVNPKSATKPVCTSVRFGRIDWAQRLN